METLRAYFDNRLKNLYSRQESGVLFRRLLQELCAVPANESYFCKDTDFSDMQVSELKAAADRLASGEPLEYITGKSVFLGMEIAVNPSVLIPRPETEELALLAIDMFKDKHAIRVMDLCCGSGCLAIAMARFLDCKKVTALDVSKEAIATAAANAAANNAAVNFVCADLLSIDESVMDNLPAFDLVCCNPPYVRECEKTDMHANVLCFEPHRALFVGDDDPLVFYRAAAEFCRHKLSADGTAFFELNRYLAEVTEAMFARYGFFTRIVTDLSGAKRFLVATNVE